MRSWILFFVPLSMMVGWAYGAHLAPSDKTHPASAALGDPAAADFMMKCAGCHSVGRGKLTGPDLKDAAGWKPSDIIPKIKLMEKRTGPLTDLEITELAKFLKDPQVTGRITTQEARMAAEAEAKYEKGNEKKGADLFYGATPMINGGLACVSCHRLQERGGNFGPNLSAVFAKMGTIPLISACEKASFREMDAVYREHPITHQEAIHLAKFLESGKSAPPSEDGAPNQVLAGAVALSLLGLGGVSAYYRKKQPGRRAPGRD
jgi:cytochrome c2